MPQNPSLKNVFFLPAPSFLLPFCRFVYNKGDSWIMILDRKHVISRHSECFVAAGESTQQALGEGKTGKERLHWYSCGSVCFLARNKEKTTKAIICRWPLPGTLRKAAHPTAVSILWLLTQFSWKNDNSEHHYKCPAPPRSSALVFFLKHCLLFLFSILVFPLVLLLLWFPSLSCSGKSIFVHSSRCHSLSFLFLLK